MRLTEQELRRSQFSYFLGKIVIIQTNHAALYYDQTERGSFTHFKTYGGVCEGFDEYGVWLHDPESKMKSFFFYSQIQGIIEQQKVTEDHPLVKRALEKVKKEEETMGFIHGGPELLQLSIDKAQKKLEENRI